MKRFLKLLLIILAILVLTLSVNAADLYGTYDQRIKVTIDHTEIDADLSWFPVDVHITSSQAEEIFTELTSDSEYKKIAVTTSDESTQLYVHMKNFDTANSKINFTTSKTGWTVSSSTDTDIYIYYDKDASDNDTYVGYAGTTAAANVYDNNFEAVYDMADAHVDYDTEYDGSVEPDSDGWTLSGTDYASSDGDILTIDTSADDSYQCYYYKTPDIDFDAGFYVKMRIKLDTIMGSGDLIRSYIQDGTQNETLQFQIYDGMVYYYNGSSTKICDMDTTTDYHIYEIYIKATTAKFYIDGVYKTSCLVDSDTTTDYFSFGENLGGGLCKAYIDYFNYALDIGYNPAAGIVDSTSNANHGDKKGSGEPVEATGKVGQGQDFDGTNDYIDCGDFLDSASEFTIEAITNPESCDSDNDIITKGNHAANSPLVIWRDESTTDHLAILITDDNTDYSGVLYSNYDFGTSGDVYITVSFKGGDASGLKAYFNGVADTGGNFPADMTSIQQVASSTDEIRLGWNQSENPVNPFDGIIDETRISSTVRSAAWIAATYDSLWDTLLTYGSEETAPTGTTTNILFTFANF